MDRNLVDRISRIKCLALDVDGIMTDCRIIQDPASGEWKRTFSIRDGYGVVRLQEAGFQIAIITASKSNDIRARAKDLRIEHLYEGSIDKYTAFEKLMEKTGFAREEIAFMGDDLFDMPVLKAVGFAATVTDAMEPVLECVQYVAKRPAGNGAVREVCELLLKYQKGQR